MARKDLEHRIEDLEKKLIPHSQDIKVIILTIVGVPRDPTQREIKRELNAWEKTHPDGGVAILYFGPDELRG